MKGELVQLAEVYRAPGLLLLARADDGARAGCVGLRALDPANEPRAGEIRRLFVRDTHRGSGIGRSLAERLIQDARAGGLNRLVLNTVPAMTEAIGLYDALGFRPCAPYVDEPSDETLYFSLDL